MLLIDYKPVDFPPQSNAELNRPHTLRCTWADLVWPAIAPQPAEETRTTIGPDGVFARLGEAWQDSKMYLPPQERPK